ncbi:MAG: hypothetical protein NZ518_03765 [Dehalococcoidia bacterium]|nr:hypothetical protein [Dehalococcoidia bacterium]
MMEQGVIWVIAAAMAALAVFVMNQAQQDTQEQPVEVPVEDDDHR